VNEKKAGLGKRLARYGVGVGAVSLAASAQAHIHYSGPLEVTGNPMVLDLRNLSANAGTNAGADFQLQADTAKLKAGMIPQTAGAGAAIVLRQGQITPATQYVLRLSSGTTIGSSLTFSAQNNYSYFNNYYPGGGPFGSGAKAGDWKPGDRGFIGLTILIGATTVYGWADITLNNLDGVNTGVYTVHSMAYEDSGASILAGQIPEPSAIALLIAGAVGVLALKRRHAKS
jgi:hypothetical protein